MYSENAVDVFDVNTMEWIQTIPLKKVSAVVKESLAPPGGLDELFLFHNHHSDLTLSSDCQPESLTDEHRL